MELREVNVISQPHRAPLLPPITQPRHGLRQSVSFLLNSKNFSEQGKIVMIPRHHNIGKPFHRKVKSSQAEEHFYSYQEHQHSRIFQSSGATNSLKVIPTEVSRSYQSRLENQTDLDMQLEAVEQKWREAGSEFIDLYANKQTKLHPNPTAN